MAISETETQLPKPEIRPTNASSLKKKVNEVESKISSSPDNDKLTVVDYFNEYGWPHPDEVLAIMRSVGPGRKLRRPSRKIGKSTP